ncbi:DinB family protein [Jiulongibacter sediminis]|uniref:DinB-like domain-containing protein n=1 Tax=Jiulongibacter sediminis TaxID=1605367 RepID=A0A0P7CA69_9BACT|nr:DinB family protein [Jiulongibacter sediminis]KPM49501.1 hypothetical protein AFM12_02540 [Jiulongibacter sediminis]TBX26545.1 hypothetical protein TK44_02545 [Jiulongibacter sediminis]
MTENFQKEFIDNCIYRLQENLSKIQKTVNLIDENLLWQRPNENSLSIGNQLLHLRGNIEQYGVSSLGNQPDHRERDLEFDTKGGFEKDNLLQKLKESIGKTIEICQSISAIELERVRMVQGYRFSGIGVLIHVVEHLSYHTGQIIFYTKALTNQQMGFYDAVNLNIKNE